MSPLVAPRSQERILAPEGTHKARLVGLVQLGTVPVEWAGETKWLEKVRLTFELPEELHKFKEDEPEKPVVISQEYTLSMGEKSNLRPVVEGIINITLQDKEADSFDVETLLGLPCLLSIKHKKSGKGNTFAVIETATPLMKKMVVPEAINPIKKLTYENWSQEEFDKLPTFIQDKMKSSRQYVKKFGVQPELPADEVNESEIPF